MEAEIALDYARLRVDGVRSHVVIKVYLEHVFDLAAVLSNGFVFFDYYATQTKSTVRF